MPPTFSTLQYTMLIANGEFGTSCGLLLGSGVRLARVVGGCLVMM